MSHVDVFWFIGQIVIRVTWIIINVYKRKKRRRGGGVCACVCVWVHVVKYGSWNLIRSKKSGVVVVVVGAHTHEKRMRWPKVPYILQPLLG